MRSPRTDADDPGRWPPPDETVEDGFGLLKILLRLGPLDRP
jgi:hypothetical protein